VLRLESDSFCLNKFASSSLSNGIVGLVIMNN
jgi:hypothetical protein